MAAVSGPRRSAACTPTSRAPTGLFRKSRLILSRLSPFCAHPWLSRGKRRRKKNGAYSFFPPLRKHWKLFLLPSVWQFWWKAHKKWIKHNLKGRLCRSGSLPVAFWVCWGKLGSQPEVYHLKLQAFSGTKLVLPFQISQYEMTLYKQRKNPLRSNQRNAERSNVGVILCISVAFHCDSFCVIWLWTT